MINMKRTLAIIAGEGCLPEIICARLFKEGMPPYVFSMGADIERLAPFARQIWTVTTPDLEWILGQMLSHKVETMILAGQVPKSLMYQRENLDVLLKQSLDAENNDDHALLSRIVRTIEKTGIKVAGYRQILSDLLTPEGQVSARGLSDQEAKDVAYGCSILFHLLPLSFGQSIVIHSGAVVAVEAMEGTDAMLQRAGTLVHGGSVIKMMRADQDERFDIPVVGTHTLHMMEKAGQTCLALEAGRTLMLEKEAFLELAARLNIAVVGVPPCLSI